MSTSAMRRASVRVAVLSSLVAALPAMAAPKADAVKAGITGCWDITVTEGNSQYPSWIGVHDDGGQRVVRFLGRAGGVGKINEFKFDEASNTVEFNAAGHEWVGKLNGNEMEGAWKQGDGKWTAKRFNYVPDMSGTWKIKLGDKTATLILKGKRKAPKGTWTEDGQSTPIADSALDHGEFTFSVGERKVQLRARGDVLDGTLQGSPITGQRERKWGKTIELFAGKPEQFAANWQTLGEGHAWKVIDGVLTNGESIDPAKASHHGTENIITQRKDFKDFKLHVEFMVPERGNSGVYLRGRYEIQIQDDYGHDIADGVCGSLYTRVLPKVNACKKPGEWQVYDITLIGQYVTVVQNGQTIIDNQQIEGITGGALDSRDGEPGPIYLQGDHSQIYYRKIELTPAE